MLQATMAALITEKSALGSELEGQRTLVVGLRREEETHRHELARQNELLAQLRQVSLRCL